MEDFKHLVVPAEANNFELILEKLRKRYYFKERVDYSEDESSFYSQENIEEKCAEGEKECQLENDILYKCISQFDQIVLKNELKEGWMKVKEKSIVKSSPLRSFDQHSLSLSTQVSLNKIIDNYKMNIKCIGSEMSEKVVNILSVFSSNVTPSNKLVLYNEASSIGSFSQNNFGNKLFLSNDLKDLIRASWNSLQFSINIPTYKQKQIGGYTSKIDFVENPIFTDYSSVTTNQKRLDPHPSVYISTIGNFEKMLQNPNFYKWLLFMLNSSKVTKEDHCIVNKSIVRHHSNLKQIYMVLGTISKYLTQFCKNQAVRKTSKMDFYPLETGLVLIHHDDRLKRKSSFNLNVHPIKSAKMEDDQYNNKEGENLLASPIINIQVIDTDKNIEEERNINEQVPNIKDDQDYDIEEGDDADDQLVPDKSSAKYLNDEESLYDEKQKTEFFWDYKKVEDKNQLEVASSSFCKCNNNNSSFRPSRRIRIGLSRRQRVKSLHPYFKRTSFRREEFH